MHSNPIVGDGDNVYVLVVDDPNSDDPYQIAGVYDSHDSALIAGMEYLDEYNPRQSNDDPNTIMTDDPDIVGHIVQRVFCGGPNNGF